MLARRLVPVPRARSHAPVAPAVVIVARRTICSISAEPSDLSGPSYKTSGERVQGRMAMVIAGTCPSRGSMSRSCRAPRGESPEMAVATRVKVTSPDGGEVSGAMS